MHPIERLRSGVHPIERLCSAQVDLSFTKDGGETVVTHGMSGPLEYYAKPKTQVQSEWNYIMIKDCCMYLKRRVKYVM